MPSDDAVRKRIQNLVTISAVLAEALEQCLARLAVLHGQEARREIETLRDELIYKFKNADIPAEREMEYAEVLGPGITALEAVFESVLSNLPDSDGDLG